MQETIVENDICPSCKGNKLYDSVMSEDGHDEKVKYCRECGWWGSNDL